MEVYDTNRVSLKQNIFRRENLVEIGWKDLHPLSVLHKLRISNFIVGCWLVLVWEGFSCPLQKNNFCAQTFTRMFNEWLTRKQTNVIACWNEDEKWK